MKNLIENFLLKFYHSKIVVFQTVEYLHLLLRKKNFFHSTNTDDLDESFVLFDDLSEPSSDAVATFDFSEADDEPTPPPPSAALRINGPRLCC